MSHIQTKEAIQEIVRLVKEAQVIASKHGWENILQPGLIKEMVIADILNHEVHKTKHQADAFEYGKPEVGFEYLTCKQGGTFQIDRVFKHPPEKRQKSLKRIIRNQAIYCAVFDSTNTLQVQEIWHLDIRTFLDEVIKQLEASSNDISHIGVTIKWVRQNGTQVYPDK
jgi:hypothetical protein